MAVLQPSGGSRGVPCFPLNPSFEGLHAFENTMRKRTTYTTLTLELRTGFSFNSSNNTRVACSMSTRTPLFKTRHCLPATMCCG